MSFLASMGIMNNALQPVFKRARAVADQGYSNAKGDINKYYDQAQGYQQPWYDAGQNWLKGFQDWQSNPNDVSSDPSYQWRLNQGQMALENSAAARGGLLSGNTAKGITDYAQNAASQEYQNQFNRWMQQLGIGQNASSNMSNLNAQRGNALAGLDVGQGQNWFNNTMQSAQEIRQAENGLNNIVQSWMPAQFGGGKQSTTNPSSEIPDKGGNYYNSQQYAQQYDPNGGTLTSGSSSYTGYPSATNYQYSTGPQWQYNNDVNGTQYNALKRGY